MISPLLSSCLAPRVWPARSLDSTQACPSTLLAKLESLSSNREEEESFLGFHLMAFYCPPLGLSYHCSSTAGLQFVFPIRFFLISLQLIKINGKKIAYTPYKSFKSYRSMSAFLYPFSSLDPLKIALNICYL